MQVYICKPQDHDEQYTIEYHSGNYWGLCQSFEISQVIRRLKDLVEYVQNPKTRALIFYEHKCPESLLLFAPKLH